MKFSFPLAYCVLLATALGAQTSTTETLSKESENCTVEGHVVLATGGGQPYDGRFSQEINIGQTVEVTNTDVNGLQIQPAPNGQVRGQFHVDSGQKVDWSQTTVRLDPDEDSGGSSSSRFGGASSRFAEVKSDGSFELKNVPARTYHLIASSRAQAMRIIL